MLPMVLESNCQPLTGTSRLSPTQCFSETLPTSDCYLITPISIYFYDD
ncbi:MAG: hypothetical protein LBK82_05070 [Planctomycetaceae bacterium]|nr:hypothetical protein [Planctomycetaceae bacterium]